MSEQKDIDNFDELEDLGVTEEEEYDIYLDRQLKELMSMELYELVMDEMRICDSLQEKRDYKSGVNASIDRKTIEIYPHKESTRYGFRVYAWKTDGKVYEIEKVAFFLNYGYTEHKKILKGEDLYIFVDIFKVELADKDIDPSSISHTYLFP